MVDHVFCSVASAALTFISRTLSERYRHDSELSVAARFGNTGSPTIFLHLTLLSNYITAFFPFIWFSRWQVAAPLLLPNYLGTLSSVLFLFLDSSSFFFALFLYFHFSVLQFNRYYGYCFWKILLLRFCTASLFTF